MNINYTEEQVRTFIKDLNEHKGNAVAAIGPEKRIVFLPSGMPGSVIDGKIILGRCEQLAYYLNGFRWQTLWKTNLLYSSITEWFNKVIELAVDCIAIEGRDDKSSPFYTAQKTGALEHVMLKGGDDETLSGFAGIDTTGTIRDYSKSPVYKMVTRNTCHEIAHVHWAFWACDTFERPTRHEIETTAFISQSSKDQFEREYKKNV